MAPGLIPASHGPSGAARESAYKCFAKQNLGAGGLCLPAPVLSGVPTGHGPGGSAGRAECVPSAFPYAERPGHDVASGLSSSQWPRPPSLDPSGSIHLESASFRFRLRRNRTSLRFFLLSPKAKLLRGPLYGLVNAAPLAARSKNFRQAHVLPKMIEFTCFASGKATGANSGFPQVLLPGQSKSRAARRCFFDDSLSAIKPPWCSPHPRGPRREPRGSCRGWRGSPP